MTTILAISLGEHPALAWRDRDGHIIADPMPRTGDALLAYMRRVVAAAGGAERLRIYLEESDRAAANEKQRSSAVSKHGGGLVVGVAMGLAVSVELVTPRRWQEALAIATPSKIARTATECSRQAEAERLYPGERVAQRTADVLLLLEYARRRELRRERRIKAGDNLPAAQPMASTSVIESGDHAAVKLAERIMIAPAGISKIIAKHRKTGGAIEIVVDVKEGALRWILDLLALYRIQTPNYRPFADANHEGQDVCFRADTIGWAQSPRPGLVAENAEWTAFGRDLTRDGKPRFFSPALILDAVESRLVICNNVLMPRKGERGSDENPAEVVGLRRCVGSVVVVPAFENISPFLARREGYLIQRDIEKAEAEKQKIWQAMRNATTRGRRRLAEDEISALIPSSAKPEDLRAYQAASEKLAALHVEICLFHASRKGARR